MEKEKKQFAQYLHAVHIIQEFDKFIDQFKKSTASNALLSLKSDEVNSNFQLPYPKKLEDWLDEFQEPASPFSDYQVRPTEKFRFLGLPRKRLKRTDDYKLRSSEQKKWSDIAINSLSSLSNRPNSH